MEIRELWSTLGERLGITSPEDSAFELAAGEPTRIEVARSGEFTDMNGRKIALTPGNLRALAASFDAKEEHLLKIGHGEIKTTTPDYGRVRALEYDAAADRLFASIEPTLALVEKNRSGAFRRVSMEGFLNDKTGGMRLTNVAFLGARRPAISELAPVALASGGEEKPFFVCALDKPEISPCNASSIEMADENEITDQYGPAFWLATFTADERKALAKSGDAMPDGSYPIRNMDDLMNAIHAIGRASDPAATKAHIIKRAKALKATDKLPADWSGSTKVAAAGETKEKEMAEEALRLAEIEKKEKAVAERAVKLAESDVANFMASEAVTKRVPLAAIKAGNLERLLSTLAVMEVNGEGKPIALAAADGKTTQVSPYEAAKAFILSMPEKVKGSETEETARKGAEEGGDEARLPTVLASMKPTPDGDEMYLATEQEIAQAKQSGETIDFYTAARRVAARKAGRG